MGSLWNYFRHELTDETNDDNSPNKNAINSKSFEYKTSIIGSTYNVDDDDLINYGPDMCEKIMEKRLVTAAQGDNPAVYDTSPIGATFTVYNKRHKIVCSSSYFIS